MNDRPSLNVSCAGIKVDCLLDTGARISVLDKSIFDKLKGVKLQKSEDKLFCANDNTLETLGTVDIKVKIG